MLTRRAFVAAAGTAAFSVPRVARAEGSKTLRFVPRTDLGILDPIWSSSLVTRNHGFLVFDTLFGQNSAFQSSPQMLAGYTVEDNDLTWRLRLRDGLTWHDGEPVLARDCVASIQRWGAKDSFGQTLLAATNELVVQDDKSFVFRLKKPFPLLPNALGKSSSYMPAMMPQRLAALGPDKQVTEIIGSGPYRFKPDERVPGAKAVYERFDKYVPQPDGLASRVAGPKRAYFDRIEWVTIPDAGTAAAALQAGEVDWLDLPSVDLLPLLKSQPGITVRILDPNGQIPVFRLNHLQPPFNNPKIRRALLAACDQSEFMTAAAGEDPSLWRDHVGFFCPNTPLANTAGLSVFDGPRDLNAARKAIIDAGYNGEPVAFLVASDFQALRALSDVAAETMKKIGLNVDYQSTDWSTVQQRRYKKDPVDKGGWSCFFGAWDGADTLDPAVHLSLRGNGAEAWFGWPTDPRIEELRNSWFDAKNLAEQKALAMDIQRQAFVSVPYIPTGQYFQPTAYRSDLHDILDGFDMFWNVKRA